MYKLKHKFWFKYLYWIIILISICLPAIYIFHYDTSSSQEFASAKKEILQPKPETQGINNTIKLGKDIPNLPSYCDDKPVSVAGCDGMKEITTDQGNTYRLIEIGGQCWFADNSKEIPDTDQGWYGFYNDAATEPNPGDGLLYTWDAAMNGQTEERAQGVCPDGWQVPSYCEILTSYTGLFGLLSENKFPGIAFSEKRNARFRFHDETVQIHTSNSSHEQPPKVHTTFVLGRNYLDKHKRILNTPKFASHNTTLGIAVNLKCLKAN